MSAASRSASTLRSSSNAADRAVGRERVDLDPQLRVGPVEVQLLVGHHDVGLRLRQLGAAHQREHPPLVARAGQRGVARVARRSAGMPGRRRERDRGHMAKGGRGHQSPPDRKGAHRFQLHRRARSSASATASRLGWLRGMPPAKPDVVPGQVPRSVDANARACGWRCGVQPSSGRSVGLAAPQSRTRNAAVDPVAVGVRAGVQRRRQHAAVARLAPATRWRRPCGYRRRHEPRAQRPSIGLPAQPRAVRLVAGEHAVLACGHPVRRGVARSGEVQRLVHERLEALRDRGVIVGARISAHNPPSPPRAEIRPPARLGARRAQIRSRGCGDEERDYWRVR